MKPMYDSKQFLKEDKTDSVNLRACKLYPNCDRRRSQALSKDTKATKSNKQMYILCKYNAYVTQTVILFQLVKFDKY